MNGISMFCDAVSAVLVAADDLVPFGNKSYCTMASCISYYMVNTGVSNSLLHVEHQAIIWINVVS